MSRLAMGVEDSELDAAKAIEALAVDLQDLLYYGEGQLIERATVRELNRCYRVMRRAVIFYREDHTLVYEAPDSRFKSKEKK
jgi:hypothetical protein